MFDSIGRGGQTKVLSPLRWVPSTGSAALLCVGVLIAVSVLQQAPPLPVPEKIIDVVFRDRPPASPPKPAAPPPLGSRPSRPNVLPQPRSRTLLEPVAEPLPEAPAEPAPELAMAGEGALEASTGVGPGILSDLIKDGTPGGTGGAGQLVEVGFGDVRIERPCELTYPPLARRQRITGEVTVEVTCAASGRVEEVRWVSGPEIFREAVMACLRETRYAPQAIPFRFRQPFSFDLR